MLLSLDDYNSMQETLHLLGSPKNAERLRESIAEFRAGKTLKRELLTNDAQNKKARNKAEAANGCKLAWSVMRGRLPVLASPRWEDRRGNQRADRRNFP
ncbi:type II toxin-antitoxin system Phd/YefM family antitoxin [Cupriavidus basilensis]